MNEERRMKNEEPETYNQAVIKNEVHTLEKIGEFYDITLERQ